MVTLALCLLLGALSGCEKLSSGNDDSQPPPRGAPEGGPREPIIEPSAAGPRATFDLGPPPTAIYRSEDTLPDELRPIADIIDSTAPDIELSACLSRAAEAYAIYHPYEPDIAPPRAFVEAALHWAGCPDSAAAVRLYYTTEDDRDGLETYLARVAAQSTKFSHVGIGRAPGDGEPYRWTWAVLLTERHFEIDPFPRAVQPGSSHTLSFTLEPHLTDPEVLVMAAGGDVAPVDLREDRRGRWHADIAFPASGPAARDALWLEILARGPLGPEVVALFPVNVGTPPPTAWEGPLPPDESWIRTPADAEQLMFRLVNRDRVRHGLGPLVFDAELAAIAREHSEDMRDNAYFAHVSPKRGTLSDRFRVAAYDARYSSENIARNPLVYDAQVGLMESLGHRANILSPRPTRVGIGVAIGTAANGERTLFLTQNFARPIESQSPDLLRDAIHDSLRSARRATGKRPLAVSSRLDRIAGDAASIAARDGFDGDRINEGVSKALERAGIAFRRFRVQYQQVLEASDFQAPEALGDSALERAGVGIAAVEPAPEGLPMRATIVLLIEE